MQAYHKSHFLSFGEGRDEASNPKPQIRQRVVVFDFDGTLTRRDTLIEFIRYAKGTWRLLAGLLLFSPLLVLMKLHLYDNGKAKQRLFSYFFKGMRLDHFDALCGRFADDSRERLLRDDGLRLMEKEAAGGARVMVVSASVDNWVAPFFQGGVRPEIVGTKIGVEDGRLTGLFTTPNCYGPEKVRRVQQAEPGIAARRTHYYIVAYGDSRGDKEMLAYADEGHYRPSGGALGEIVRFGIVGVTATLLQYGIYFALIQFIGDGASAARQHFLTTAAMTVGYALSFVFNFFASTRFTFRVKANARRGAGFLFSHAVNYLLQMLTLNLFLWLGVPKAWAPIPMFCVCVPVNFLLVRFFLKR